MSDEKKYSLPDMEHRFQIQCKGGETGINWVGDFKYKRPTLGARGRIAALRCRLNGDIDNMDDSEVEDLNHMIAYLRHTLVDSPQWWQEAVFGNELYDGNLVSEIYNKCMDFEAEWKKKVHGGEAKDVEVMKDAASEAEEIVRNGGGEAAQP